MVDELEALRAYAHEATKVITGLAGGGSENFSGQIGDMFKADLEFCAKKIRDRHEMIHGLLVKAKKENDELREAGLRLLKACDAFDGDELHTDDSVCGYSDALEDFRAVLSIKETRS